MPAAPPPLSWLTKITYASSAIPTMIEQRGLSAFLLIFYNQVIGLPAHVVATVLLAASIFDAFCDPAVGYLSDNFHSRWGRRHPFIYASVIPVSVGYLLLWCPPGGWSQTLLAAYLMGTLLVVRAFDSFFELPSSALLPDLTQSYDERTQIISLRMLFGLLGGMLMTMLAYRVFLKENPDGTGGVLARDGYFSYGVAAAVVIAVAILLSALGTHRRIPHLRKPTARTPGLKAIFHEVGAMLNNRSLVALLATGMLMSVCNGAKTALELYFGLYFWGLSQAQLSMLVVATLVGIVAGVSIVPVLARKLGKRAAAAILIVGGILGNVGPVLARLIGIMPANGTKALFTILFADAAFMFCVATMANIVLTSMMNDLVEDVEVKTGRRSEGMLLAADSLFKKLVSSTGIFISGVLLTLIGFPQKAERAAVAPEIVEKLAYGYIPVTVFYVLALCMLYFYRIDRRVHESNLRTLRQRAEASSR